jgi:hypothetical protein
MMWGGSSVCKLIARRLIRASGVSVLRAGMTDIR